MVALHLAAKHPATPWYAKFIILIILAYALSPIDLIPDFIPVIGLLDDLLLLPVGIWLAIKMIPEDILAECTKAAQNYEWKKKKNFLFPILIILLWLFFAGVLARRYL